MGVIDMLQPCIPCIQVNAHTVLALLQCNLYLTTIRLLQLGPTGQDALYDRSYVKPCAAPISSRL